MGKSLLITHLDGNLKDGKFAQTSVISQTLVRLLKNFFPPLTLGTINFISNSLRHSVVEKKVDSEILCYLALQVATTVRQIFLEFFRILFRILSRITYSYLALQVAAMVLQIFIEYFRIVFRISFRIVIDFQI